MSGHEVDRSSIRGLELAVGMVSAVGGFALGVWDALNDQTGGPEAIGRGLIFGGLLWAASEIGTRARRLPPATENPGARLVNDKQKWEAVETPLEPRGDNIWLRRPNY